MKWQDKINKKDIKHLRESGITTKYQLEKQKDFILKQRESGEHPSMICFDCINILRKLDMWEH